MRGRTRKLAAYLLPLAWVGILLAFYGRLSPVVRLLGATAGLLFAIKVGAWLLLQSRSTEYELSRRERVVFWTVWPGVRPDEFADSDDPRPVEARDFVVGYAFVLVGVLLGLAALVLLPAVGTALASWLLILAILSCVHFGFARLLPFALRWAGLPVPDLFNEPLRSRGIGDFWSDRWNRPFVGMNRLFVTRPLAPRIGIGAAAFVAFVVSGLLHELAISYAAGSGWGLPFLYFVVQSVLYATEQKLFPDLGSERPLVARAWTWAGLLLPLPLLFHGPFRQAFVVPLLEGGRAVFVSQPLSAYLAAGLWIGALGHFLVLAASFQVPRELEWKEDLQTLNSLNRKLMWTYGGFIVLSIVSFGVLTALFHGEFLAGNPVALGLAGMITVFWVARVVVDAFYFSHDDWPDGVKYIVGHTMLTSLFLALVLVYAGTIVYHLP